ncbi:2-dehydro-3-deoxygluconokinase [Alteribacter lacisalsi]|uniref:2-dehydro-3-deoxygluconokinase n=1 Tax=Alteribacter lacisalsi TaxID=2045244 RepID=A0A2W0HF24_9BACI|nr:sugar kinase [Alteribacter lacisalsi]PYZ95915.1 2-dehydro-3-deoxygluconokinase [Alteribacter lacisalsi]
MQPDLITFGETMVIFDPAGKGPLRYVSQFNKRFGGAESNVAIGVSRLGHQAGWMSRVGDEELGTYVVNAIRGEGVDTSRVTRTSEAPTGLYIKERVREGSNQVYYYREGSAASRMSPEHVDWDYVKKAKVIHLSGITPFLSESCREMTLEVLRYAKENGIYVSFDPNLRLKILQKYPDHKELLLQIAKEADLFMPGYEEAQYLFGTDNPEEMIERSLDAGADQVVLKKGAEGIYFAEGDGDRGFVESFKVDKVVDPIGAGDGFAAGVLSGVLEGKTLREAVEQGAAIGAMVVTVEGDIEGLPTKKEIEAFKGTNSDVVR